MEAILLALGFIAYAVFVGVVFYSCCKATNEVDYEDEKPLKK